MKDAYQRRITGREANGKTTITSPREIRKSVAQLFKHSLLIPLTQEEKGVLKEQAKMYLHRILVGTREILNNVLSGKTSCFYCTKEINELQNLRLSNY